MHTTSTVECESTATFIPSEIIFAYNSYFRIIVGIRWFHFTINDHVPIEIECNKLLAIQSWI